MPEQTERTYPSIEMIEAGKIMRKLHDQVIGQRHRVHLTRDDCDEVCIMVSKCELESLEKALAIFADTQAFTQMCDNLQNLLKTAGLVYSPQVYEPGDSGSTYAK